MPIRHSRGCRFSIRHLIGSKTIVYPPCGPPARPVFEYQPRRVHTNICSHNDAAISTVPWVDSRWKRET